MNVNNRTWTPRNGSSYYGASVGGFHIGDPFLGSVIGGIGKALVGGVKGFVTGGPLGAVGGAISSVVKPKLVKPGTVAAAQGGGGLFSRFQINPPGAGAPGAGITLPPTGLRIGVAEQGVRTNGRGAGLPMVGEIGGEPALMSQTVRRCPRGQVLAVDGRCYPRSMVPKSLRAWPADTKPPITRADMKAINRANAAKKRVRGLAGKVGYTCATRGRRAAVAGKKK